jgi:hypothetical protein
LSEDKVHQREENYTEKAKEDKCGIKNRFC